MKKEEFLVVLEDILQIDHAISENQNLEELDEWDSLSEMAIMACYKKNFNVDLVVNSFKNIKTPLDLIKLAGDHVNG